MNKNTQRLLTVVMAWLGLGGAAVTVLLRVWLMPTLRDSETGLFASGWGVVGFMLLVVLALGVMAFMQPRTRREIAGPSASGVGFVTLLAGALLTVCGVWDGWLWWGMGQMPAPETATNTGLTLVALNLQLLFAVLAGLALVRTGLLLVAERATRRGIAGWTMLAPVLWMWFRLARYEMSYVSTVRLNESIYQFGMFILELLFLFKLARYTAGVGKASAGWLQFFGAATALFALSAPLTRLAMYLLGDSEAYMAGQLAGAADVAVGLLGAAVAFGLAYSREPAPEELPQGSPDVSDEDADEVDELSAGDVFDFIIGE